jgi:CO/xanthine dehydrogenase FAD-binding subunit
MLTGQRVTETLAAQAGESAVQGARALSRNGYKIPLTKAVVRRAILEALA